MTNDSPSDSAEQTPDTEPERTGVSGLQVVQSTMAAALGVQTSKNRERDFQQGKPAQFIIAGIVFTVVFVAVMVLIVRTVLGGA